MSANKVYIGDFLERIRRPVNIEDKKEYQLVTVRLHHKGVVERCRKRGSEIRTKKMYEVKAGDFILSGIDARNGAFGIVPDELNGAVVTNDFWYFKVDEAVIDKRLFLEITSTDWFDDICRKGSDGTTQRIRLQKDKFFNQPVTLPPKDQQPALLVRLLNSKQTIQDLTAERKKQSDLLSKLRQAILQEAIQGKLTADLPCRQAGWRDSKFRNYSGKWVPEHSNRYFAYVLECEDGSLYKGSTKNLFERINRHLEGRGGEWTRKHKPIRLIHFEGYTTQEEAVKREKYFKSGSGREWLLLIKAKREKQNESASELLKRIAAEKAELVKTKKIRKHPPAGRAGKPLPPITDDDLPAGKAGIPFDIPETWEWCHAGDLFHILRGKSPMYAISSTECAINQKCVRWEKIDLSYTKMVHSGWFNTIPQSILTSPEDLLLNSTGDGTIGRCAYVDNSCSGFIYDSHVLLLRRLLADVVSRFFCNGQVKTDTHY